MHIRKLLIILLIFATAKSYCQPQDVDFHLNASFLPGKTVIKVKRDFYDPYVWVLAKNNEVYRINSITKIVDDYTSQFAACSTLQFIDIAGRSKDTVFIATNSTNVIQYKQGSIRIITASDGIPYAVNSIGMEKSILGMGSLHTLMIATNKGFCTYDMDAEQPVKVQDNGVSKVFEATYRRQVYKDSSSATSDFITGDTIQYLPVVHKGEFTTFVGYLWEGGKQFGYNINTAYNVTPSIYGYDDLVDYASLIWGNSKGLFQNNANDSYSSQWPHAHYLDGINVNKVTSIYGLVALGDGWWYGDPRYIKENLLVGTDQGLYFSSSYYNQYTYGALRNFSLFHYDELGNIRVNDICVNAASITEPICEDGVWLACDNGLYLIKPDYGKYLNNQQFKAASFKGLPDTVSSLKICLGSTTTAMINTSAYSGNTIQWYKDGNELPSETKNSLLISARGDYYAVLYDPCENIHLESNHLKAQTISAPVFSFNYPTALQYCDSTSTTLKTDNSPGYHYRWYSDGVLNGDTTYKYTVTQSGKYKVEVSACAGSWMPSKEVEVDLINLPDIAVTANKSRYCAGDTAVLTSNTPDDPAYTICWYKDGNIIAAAQNKVSVQVSASGNYSMSISSNSTSCRKSSAMLPIAFTPAPVFTFDYPDKLRYCKGTPVALKATGSAGYRYRWYKDDAMSGDTTLNINVIQSGKYSVEVSACEGSWMPSKEVQVNLVDLPLPTITTDKPAYCIGDKATLSVGIAADPGYTINWYKDNILLPANANQTSMSTSDAGRYTVSVISNLANTDGTFCTQTSAAKNLDFNPPPQVSIQKIVGATLCDGQTVYLKVSNSAGSVKWSTGETSDQIAVSSSGSYRATITTDSGCAADAAIDVQFLLNPVLNIPTAGICSKTNKTATLIAPSGMTSYVWNGKPGSETYTTDHAQTVTLTVTAANGCQATQQIQVTDECPDIKIPNAFTPNGDGINDTWGVTGLEYDQTALVRVFTRYGQQVYQSKGYGTAWDGEFQGKKLPIGAYYYIISAKNGSQTYSGEVTILY